MKRMRFFLGICLLLGLRSNAQLNERFDDGDFIVNPEWTGDTALWKINNDGRLQTSSSEINGIYYLSAENKKVIDVEWRFYIELHFNTSSVNYADVYLSSNSSNLKQTDITGYFVRIGNTTDEISLYRKDKLSSTKIIDGADQKLNSSKSIIYITVKRNAKNEWQLFTKVNQQAETIEGMATDSSYLSGNFFGILVKQSTSSFFNKHFFDEISIQKLIPDTIPPKIKNVIAIDKNKMDILFEEPVEKKSAELTSNYEVDHSLFMPVSSVVDSVNNSLVHLIFKDSFPPRTILNLSIKNVSDLTGNLSSNLSTTFHYYIPIAFDIIIDEIMSDPSPSVALPEVEWVEIKNNCSFPINLKGWKIANSTTISSPLRDCIIAPDSLLILGSGTASLEMSVFGKTLNVNGFPSLNNSGDLLYLISPEGKTIHALKYSDKWYQNNLKKTGGWSLEMIDVDRPCSSEENWQASVSIAGGTPGKLNSCQSILPDNVAPKVIHAFAEDNLHIVIYMSEPIDSITATKTSFYFVSDGIGNPSKVIVMPPLFDKIVIELKTPLSNKKIHTISITGITDCSGNMIHANEKIMTGIDESAESGDVVINEILFNPKGEGSDWIELYNRSKKILNLKNLIIGSLNSLGESVQLNALSDDNYLFFPGEYLVITEDASFLLRDYLVKSPDKIFLINYLPSMPDDAGRVVLLNEQGAVVDKLFYNEDWHYKLLNNTEGISLERISYDAPTQQEDNWHSAAESVGYATPSYANSQQKNTIEINDMELSCSEYFSPDNNGVDDLLLIQYRFPEPGYVMNIMIYDASGKRINHLTKNVLCGKYGFYKWDGLDERKQPAASGVYILYAEAFNLKGEIKKHKKPFVLVR
ncbi:MAG: hypothetical protein FGM46_00605 [Ferruginibacter sp.]|nr:hypothetical protein [Ferruginibacter sp.]